MTNRTIPLVEHISHPTPRPRAQREWHTWATIALMVLLLALSACAAPVTGSGQGPNVQATVDAALKATAEAQGALQAAVQAGIAGTATAEAIRQAAAAPTATPVVPTATPVPPTPTAEPPTATPVPPTPTFTPEPPTPTPAARLEPNDNINVRGGPGTNYPIVGTLSRGQSALVTGTDPTGSWLRFDYLGREGWVARSLVTVTGDVGGIKVAQNIPPSPVPTPTPLPTNTPLPTRTPTAVPAPQASFRADKTRGVWPLRVQFTDTSTNAVSWSWNFGDGTTSTARNPNHTYQREGSYRAELTVTNSAGQRSVSSLTITVSGSFGVHAEKLIGPFGKWGKAQYQGKTDPWLAQMKYCPIDQVAIGFNIKALGPQGSGDDKALTGIRLVCGKMGPSGTTITDEEWREGNWGDKPAMCASGSYLVAARLRINENPVDRDEVGATNASFVCTDGRTLSFSHTAESGSWTDYQRCPTDTVICGINTLVLNAGPINYPNYMGVADAAFACCYSR